MQHSFAWAFRSCANRILHSVSTIYCSFHSASYSSGSYERSLQPSLWLPKMSSLLQKPSKSSTALHASSQVRYVAPIEFFCSVSTIYSCFHSASHSCGSDYGSLQPLLWLPRLSSMLLKLVKCSTSLNRPLGVPPIEFFTQFVRYTALSTQPANHVAVMGEAYSHHYGCQS